MATTTTKTGTDWLRKIAAKVTDGPELPVTTAVAAAVEVEGWLQRLGVQYAPACAIPMHMLDEKKSRMSQARRDAILSDSVDRFAAAMKAGASFPPIVVYANAGKLVIIDGNNRQAAARKAGKEYIVGIVVADDTPSEMISLMTVEANAHHGVTPDLSWRLQQAFHLCSLGFTDQQASDASAVSVPQLRTARAVQEADQRSRALRIHGFTEMAVATRQVLGALKDDAVFYQAARVAVDTGMTIDEVREMTRAVKTMPSEGARVEHIGSIAKARGIEKATRKVMGKALNRVNSPKTALVAGIGKVMAVDIAALVRQIHTTHDLGVIRQRLTLAEQKIAEVRLALGTLNDLGDEE